MEKFKFSGHASSWPGWFDNLAQEAKARITIGTDPSFENDDDCQEHWGYVAYLWTLDGIDIAYEGDTILNHGTYCRLEKMACNRF